MTGSADISRSSAPAVAVGESTVATRQALISSCQGLVRNIAWKIHQKLPKSIELDDLIAYGQVGLAQAAAGFDPARPNQFTTFAYYRIRGAIMDGLEQLAWFSKARFYSSQYEQMAQDVLDLDSSTPSSSAVQTSEEVTWFSQLTASLSIAYLSGTVKSDASNVAEPGPAPDARLMEHELGERLWKLVDALPGEAGSLIRSAYCDGLSLTEIAQRMGMSKAWVSRLHAKTLQRLARALRMMSLGEA